MAVVVLVAFTGCTEGAALEEVESPRTTALVTSSSTSSTTIAPTTTLAPTTTASAPRSVSILLTGDSMAHGAVTARGRRNAEGTLLPYDFAPMWQLVAPIVSRADFAVCHLETTIASGDEMPTGFPRFRAPKDYVAAIAGAGYDACSTASNHAFDYSADGVIETIDVLEASGLGWAGTARSADEASRPHLYTASGVKIAMLSATYGLNGFRLPDDQPWLVDAIDIPRLLTEAQAARTAGADIVIVSLHCCVEYRVEPTQAQLDNARALLESPDVDLVVGHHAHVVQPIERIGDEYVLYGLGNILSNMYDSRCCPASSQDGVVVEVMFTEGSDGRFTTSGVVYTPTWVDRAAGFVITPVVAALQDQAISPERRAQLDASLLRTANAINARGAADAGVTLAR